MCTSAASIASVPEFDAIAVLVVSPSAKLRVEFREKLRAPQWALAEAAGGAEAMEYLCMNRCEMLVLDPLLHDLDSNEFRLAVAARYPQVQVVTVNAYTGQIMSGPGSPTRLAAQLAANIRSSIEVAAPAQVRHLRTVSDRPMGLSGMVGDSDEMRRIYELTHMVAQRDTTVLVTGESGTGKDLVAQAIHRLSPRRHQPFAVINCAAIPEPLLEAELFGHTKGSFTGAVQSRMGRIQAAHEGTLFLDEIGDMPLSLQSKILRFLEQGEVQRIGGNENFKVDVRVIAATNSNLLEMVERKLFREDLYYRLAIFPIHLPPLRRRAGDIRKLAELFLDKFSPGASLTREALLVLEEHDWPGNVRELRNVLERCSILAENQSQILPIHVLI